MAANRGEIMHDGETLLARSCSPGYGNHRAHVWAVIIVVRWSEKVEGVATRRVALAHVVSRAAASEETQNTEHNT